jgi:ubiquinone/menaquinone biosynthesis C-methylase UbiE
MFIKFDKELEKILCCPNCKGSLKKIDDAIFDGFECNNCGLFFPLTQVKISEGQYEDIYDFRIKIPNYCIPASKMLWKNSQKIFEQYSCNVRNYDNFTEYLNEIDSVKEIYTEQYHLGGRILDVGGEQGRLRHFLKNDTTMYVNIDPFLDAFQNVNNLPNLQKAYPCLREPCYFLSANAENLSFIERSFDWVHMRSTLDHFEDPFKALLEAYRVAKFGGNLLIGLAIMEKLNTQMDRDDHMFRLTHEQLLDLMQTTGWEIVQEHWQKKPWDYCVYIQGTKK